MKVIIYPGQGIVVVIHIQLDLFCGVEDILHILSMGGVTSVD